MFSMIRPKEMNRFFTKKAVTSLLCIFGLIVFCCLSTQLNPVNEVKRVHFDFKSLQLRLNRNYSTDIAHVINSEMTGPNHCDPILQIVFVKTYKTASTTTAAIFERYGYYRQLTFAVGKSHVLSFQSSFSHRNVMNFPKMEGKPYNILCNHARYNRKEMELVVPNATYVTILRKPEDQLESAFGYFEMYKAMGLPKKNALHTFMEDPIRYYKGHNFYKWQLSRNGQLFGLGFDHRYDDSEMMIQEKVQEIDKDFDLVLITEYYDESLLLLKKLLCWDFEDILYIPTGIRSTSHRFMKDGALIEKLRRWNHGDTLLYEHFNKTLWRKISEYGSSFYADLEYFRQLNQAVFEECIESDKKNKRDPREFRFVLKNQTDRCAALLRADVGYTNLIRRSMLDRFGKPWFWWIPFI